jgi:hypothetical protein
MLFAAYENLIAQAFNLLSSAFIRFHSRRAVPAAQRRAPGAPGPPTLGARRRPAYRKRS